MKIKFRDAGQRGYFVQAQDDTGRLREYGAVDKRGGVFGPGVWVVTEIRGKARADGPSFRDVHFKTRNAAAKALIEVVRRVEG